MVDGAFSDTTSVVSGVLQGSVLGPLLFLTSINHVSSLTHTDGSKLTMCADDILLYKPISQSEDYIVAYKLILMPYRIALASVT